MQAAGRRRFMAFDSLRTDDSRRGVPGVGCARRIPISACVFRQETACRAGGIHAFYYTGRTLSRRGKRVATEPRGWSGIDAAVGVVEGTARL